MTSAIDLYVLMPELSLALFGFILLLAGVFTGNRVSWHINMLGILAFAASAFFMLTPERMGHMAGDWGSSFAGNYMFSDNDFTRFAKLLLLAAGALVLAMSHSYNNATKNIRFEYGVLVVFATLGMMLMVSANDLLSLYVGLELQSLALYVLATMNRDDRKSSEAGLKYFVLGSLASGILLYGISLLYGYAGTTDFIELAFRLRDAGGTNVGVTIGLVFVVAAMAFKVSAAPFHMWTPDVYEGAPTPVVAFFASAPKIAALALMARIFYLPFSGLGHEWVQVLFALAIASMLVGSFAGLVQKNLKRLMAYSSIANVGFALVAILAHSRDGAQALLVYLAIYFANVVGAFAVIMCLRRQGKVVDEISDLSGIGKTNPMLALCMTIFMFSMAGVPPFAGFFGKYFVFLSAVKAGYIPLVVIGVLSSVVSAYYYIRIVKVMYFDEAQNAIDAVRGAGAKLVLTLTASYMIIFTLFPSYVVDKAMIAAKAIVPGG